MLEKFPHTYKDALDWTWQDFEPYARELKERVIDADTLHDWLADQSRFLEIVYDLNGRLSVAVDQDNTDQAAKARRDRFREEVWPNFLQTMNDLEKKLVEADIMPAGYQIQMKGIQNSLSIFNSANIDLEIEERAIRDEFEKLNGSVKLEVNGGRHSIYDILRMLHIEPDRAKREYIYKNILNARTNMQNGYDQIWKKFFAVRQKIAANAGMLDFRAYMWNKLDRQDYSPQDMIDFCEAIEEVVVPVIAKLRKQEAAALGIEAMKPWDRSPDATASYQLRPYQSTEEWLAKSRQVFDNISPGFSEHFDLMRAEGLLDLESRENKSPWNYAERLYGSNRTFVFINGRGSIGDLYMLFHEFGHATHFIEMAGLPYIRQKMLPDEISEVASTTMELLASDQLEIFFSPEDASLVRRNHVTSMLNRFTSSAMAALFQHWAYTHPEEGADPDACDQYWMSLCGRFIKGVDYTGFEDDLRMQWREVFQVMVFPFYMIEYAFALMGALQVWQNYHSAPEKAIKDFRQALAKGRTVSVPEFYAQAGGKFGVDAETLRRSISVAEKVLF